MKTRLVPTPLSALSVDETTSGTATQPPPEPPAAPAPAAEPTPTEQEAVLEDSAKFREDLLRRYAAPYPESWSHGGLND
jgi:hypothetical protein